MVIEMTHIAKMINDKLNGLIHSKEDFAAMIESLREKTYDEAQLAAWLMAVRCLGLSKEETALLTESMVTKPHGGEILTSVIDKHSTGGVGDSVTLLVVPIVAACGVPMIKLSGKMLGFTGGTIDKLLAIPGIHLEKQASEIKKQVEEVGAYIGMQTEDLCFADKIMYELRDRTGSVASIPLICSSILSKKFSTGAEKLVINLKYGQGAFIDTSEEAEILKDYMIYTCEKNHVPVSIITEETNQPIADVVGTGLEIQNVYRILNNEKDICAKERHVIDVSMKIATEMLVLVKNIDHEAARNECFVAWNSSKAKYVFENMIASQNGRLNELLAQQPMYRYPVQSNMAGTLQFIDTTKLGQLVNDYAASDDFLHGIDPMFGLIVEKHLGDNVQKDDTLVTVCYNEALGSNLEKLVRALHSCYEIK